MHKTFDAGQVTYSAHDNIDKTNRSAFGDLEAMRIEVKGVKQADTFRDLAIRMTEAAKAFEESSNALADVAIQQSKELANTFRALVRKYNETIGEIYDKLDFEK